MVISQRAAAWSSSPAQPWVGGGCLQQVTSGKGDWGLLQRWGLLENPSL